MSFVTMTDKEVKCRKKHSCVWCGYAIEPGEKAQYVTGIWEGHYSSSYYHPERDQAARGSADLSEGFELYAQERGKTFEESHGW